CAAQRREDVAFGVLLDELRHQLGGGLGWELVTLRLELRLELGGVLDDAVVNHEDLAVAVRVRVGVDVGRFAVRGPARVANAELACGHVRVELLDQGVDLGLGLGDAGPGRGAILGQLEDGYARRVVATVFEPFEALHEDRRRFTAVAIADDPGQLYTSTRTTGFLSSTVGGTLNRLRGQSG